MHRARAIEKRQPYIDGVRTVLDRIKREHAEQVRAEEALRNAVDTEAVQSRLQTIRDNMNMVRTHNEQMQIVHAQREQHNIEKKEKKLKREEERRAALEERRREANREVVRNLIEESRNFITADNMDEILEQVVTNPPVNFNYAITPTGKKIHSTKPPGNLDGWDGAPPSAFIAGGTKENSEEFQQMFEGKDVGYYARRGGFFGSTDKRKRKTSNANQQQGKV